MTKKVNSDQENDIINETALSIATKQFVERTGSNIMKERWERIRSEKCFSAIRKRIIGLRGIVSVVEEWPIFYVLLGDTDISEIVSIFARYCGVSFEVLALQEFPKNYSYENKTYWNAIMADENHLWIHGDDPIGLLFILNIIIEELLGQELL